MNFSYYSNYLGDSRGSGSYYCEVASYCNKKSRYTPFNSCWEGYEELQAIEDQIREKKIEEQVIEEQIDRINEN